MLNDFYITICPEKTNTGPRLSTLSKLQQQPILKFNKNKIKKLIKINKNGQVLCKLKIVATVGDGISDSHAHFCSDNICSCICGIVVRQAVHLRRGTELFRLGSWLPLYWAAWKRSALGGRSDYRVWPDYWWCCSLEPRHLQHVCCLEQLEIFLRTLELEALLTLSLSLEEGVGVLRYPLFNLEATVLDFGLTFVEALSLKIW